MLKFVLGFALGYWTAFNKDTVKTYWDQLKTWISDKKTNKVENENA